MSAQRLSKGISGIEVILVAAIICGLGFAVLFVLNTAKAQGRDSQRIADIKQLQLALGLYFDAHSVFPASLGQGKSGPLVEGGYIQNIPVDQTTGKAYFYVPYAVEGVSGVCVGYHLGATLEDTKQAVLTHDADIYIGSDPRPDEQVPPGVEPCVSGAADFHGSDASSCAGETPGRACYDVTP